MQEHGTGRSRPRGEALRCVGAGEESKTGGEVVVSSLGTRDIFRQLIVNEIRAGRLTPARRRRIIAYAAQLGLSAVEVGELIARSREDLLAGDDPVEQALALRVVVPAPRRIGPGLRMALVAITAIVLELLYLNWRW